MQRGVVSNNFGLNLTLPKSRWGKRREEMCHKVLRIMTNDCNAYQTKCFQMALKGFPMIYRLHRLIRSWDWRQTPRAWETDSICVGRPLWSRTQRLDNGFGQQCWWSGDGVVIDMSVQLFSSHSSIETHSAQTLIHWTLETKTVK